MNSVHRAAFNTANSTSGFCFQQGRPCRSFTDDGPQNKTQKIEVFYDEEKQEKVGTLIVQFNDPNEDEKLARSRNVVFVFLGFLLAVGNIVLLTILRLVDRLLDRARHAISALAVSLEPKFETSPIFEEEARLREVLVGAVKNGIAQRRAEEDLQLLKGAGKAVAQVAHDLRSPLSAISLALSGLPKSDCSDVIAAANSRLSSIVDSSLANYRDTSQGLPFSEVYKPVLREKRLLYPEISVEERTTQAAKDFNVKRPVDLQRTLSNLINNAAEASSPNSTVTLGADIQKDFFLMTVSDSGKGISQEILTRLRGDGGTFGKMSGHGLGLEYAKSFANAVSGTLQIESTLGQGTTVKISIPLGET